MGPVSKDQPPKSGTSHINITKLTHKLNPISLPFIWENNGAPHLESFYGLRKPNHTNSF